MKTFVGLAAASSLRPQEATGVRGAGGGQGAAGEWPQTTGTCFGHSLQFTFDTHRKRERRAVVDATLNVELAHGALEVGKRHRDALQQEVGAGRLLAL